MPEDARECQIAPGNAGRCQVVRGDVRPMEERKVEEERQALTMEARIGLSECAGWAGGLPAEDPLPRWGARQRHHDYITKTLRSPNPTP